MAFRTHASLLDAARLATLAAALLAPTTAGVGGVAHDPGMPAAPPVLSEQARSQAYDTVWENLRLAAIDQEAAAPEAWGSSRKTSGGSRRGLSPVLLQRWHLSERLRHDHPG